MTERNGCCIGSVGWGQQLGEAKQGLHHLADLVLTGRAVPGHGLLDLVGRVLSNIATGYDRFGHDDPASHPDSHRSTDILLEQHPLDRDDVRTDVCDQRTDFELEFGEPLGQIDPRIRPNHTCRNGTRRTSTLDAAVAAPREARVDPENEHLYDSSWP